MPVGISFMGTAWSEPALMRIATGLEAAANARRKPQFPETLPTDGGGVGLRGRGRRPQKPTGSSPVVGGSLTVAVPPSYGNRRGAGPSGTTCPSVLRLSARSP